MTHFTLTLAESGGSVSDGTEADGKLTMMNIAACMQGGNILASFDIGEEHYHVWLDPQTTQLVQPVLYKSSEDRRVVRRLNADAKRNQRLIRQLVKRLKAKKAIELAVRQRQNEEDAVQRRRHVIGQCRRYWVRQMHITTRSPIGGIGDFEFAEATEVLVKALETS